MLMLRSSARPRFSARLMRGLFIWRSVVMSTRPRAFSVRSFFIRSPSAASSSLVGPMTTSDMSELPHVPILMSASR